MTIRSLAEVGARLEEAVALLPGCPGSPQDLYDRYEMIAIAILDAEFAEHPPGVLEAYLMAYLRLKELELGVCHPPATHP
ncbi:hypothetical protein NOR51B_1668 [Luminiphilus syltensis NOR5-1B]|uniref:Uncharacterized protein n=1 Tax=Luminiphilus syltensis NOR5-1B TaxID=565045 RepID=B8KVU0_9GAMM|nr:hypothetical protein [Luminiphilus syltensis]EED35721.1 hypothetical protein NOR51B_1668 [Luminiphilus syltensis NOR5-1B]